MGSSNGSTSSARARSGLRRRDRRPASARRASCGTRRARAQLANSRSGSARTSVPRRCAAPGPPGRPASQNLASRDGAACTPGTSGEPPSDESEPVDVVITLVDVAAVCAAQAHGVTYRRVWNTGPSSDTDRPIAPGTSLVAVRSAIASASSLSSRATRSASGVTGFDRADTGMLPAEHNRGAARWCTVCRTRDPPTRQRQPRTRLTFTNAR